MNKSILNQISKIVSKPPQACIILGSGLNDFCDSLKNKKVLSYSDIKGFPQTSVKGHKGEFIYGLFKNSPILCASGRFHYYEKFSFEEIGILIKIFKHFKPKCYIITNSSGCLRLDWKIGSFMLVEEFIDFSFIQSNKSIKYKLQNILSKKINIHKGTYTYTIGPTYETKSEIQEIINCGGDAVGMSTFPEYLMCRKLNINPIIISCLTNYGAGLINKKVSHKDVLFNAEKVKDNFISLLIKIIENIEPQKIQKK